MAVRKSIFYLVHRDLLPYSLCVFYISVTGFVDIHLAQVVKQRGYRNCLFGIGKSEQIFYLLSFEVIFKTPVNIEAVNQKSAFGRKVISGTGRCSEKIAVFRTKKFKQLIDKARQIANVLGRDI